MSNLYLNALPVEMRCDAATVVAYALDRDDERDRALARADERGREWQFYTYREYAYAWALSGDLPAPFDSEGRPVKLSELPGAVLAFAVREAAVAKLMHEGFELQPGSLAMPARLSRQRINLIQQAAAKAPDGVGAYAALALQGLPLFDDGRTPGEVALVVDQWVEHRLPLALDALHRAGVEFMGARVRWQHAAGCSCLSGRVGDAGKVVGGEPAGTVTVLDSGIAQEVPGACLSPHATSHMLSRYLASLNGRSEMDVARELKKVIDSFAEVKGRWSRLEKTAAALGELQVFPNGVAVVGKPLEVPWAQNLAGQRRPRTLATLSDTNLNFEYGAPALASTAASGLYRHGPYDEHQDRVADVTAVIVAPAVFEAEAKRLRRVLTDGVENFQGMEARYHLRSFAATIETFAGKDANAYRGAVVHAAQARPDIVFFVIERADRYARRGQNPYYAAKAALGSANMPSQGITVETLRQPDFSLRYSADSLALAAYAKVGNIPYVLHAPKGARELVLGVGRADIYDESLGRRKQRFGASVAVRQDGDFLFSGSTTPVASDDDYEASMTELIAGAIKTFEADQGFVPERLIVYLFKRTGRRELNAIRTAIRGRNIEFALVHVNRDSPLWLVEGQGGAVRAPVQGTHVALSLHDRLLITGDSKRPGAAHALRLTLDDRSTFRLMNHIVEQAYGFTKTSYRSFHASSEPSPILFGRELAKKLVELAPYGFDPATAAGPFGRTPWFL